MRTDDGEWERYDHNRKVWQQTSDGRWVPARPLRASWEWRLMFSDWLEDTLIPWLRRPAPARPPE